MPRIHDSGISAIITPKSPKSFRIAVETLAYYFRREFSYDFCQYCAEEGSDESEHRAYLWTTARAAPYNQHAIIGACCFRKRHYDEPLPPGVPADCYALQWIWFHPYERRQGHLTRALPYFQSSLRPTYCRRSL
jgi:hypothetical protein